MTIALETGPAIEKHVTEVAALQARVFRAFPHLCDWDADHYERLLRLYTRSSDHMFLVLVRDNRRLVGASSGRSLINHFGLQDEAVELFRERGYAPEEVFYCADSVLLSEYRERGFGVEFFRRREQYAVESGYRWSIFGAVQRANDHPQRPARFKSLESFWSRRGYAALPDTQLEYRWTDIGDAQSSSKPMQLYVKSLAGVEVDPNC